MKVKTCFNLLIVIFLAYACGNNLRSHESITYDSEEVLFTYTDRDNENTADLYPVGWRIKFRDSIFTSKSSKVYLISDSRRNELIMDTIDIQLYSDFTNEYKDQQEVSYFSAELISDSIIVINNVYSKGIGLLDIESGKIQNLGYEDTHAAVYKRNGIEWSRVSPVYARVTAVRNGFIVKTPRVDIPTIHVENEGMLVYVDSADANLNNPHSEERFLLLNSTFKAISFLDYYDFYNIQDLGFGLQFETDKGAFFVSYDGKAITNDDWDYFELDNKRLKAVRYDPDFPDNGTDLFDEWGNIIDPKPSIVEYFDL